MDEWSTGRKRLVGVVLAVVVVLLAYGGIRWLWGLLLEMHHM